MESCFEEKAPNFLTQKKDGKILSLFHTTHERRQTQNSLASELQFFPAYVRCYLWDENTLKQSLDTLYLNEEGVVSKISGGINDSI